MTPTDDAGYLLDEAEVVFWGLCPDCRARHGQSTDDEGAWMSESTPPTTTDGGAPVASDEHSLTVGPDGPILLHDHYLIEQMANFNRERIPERQPHAKGGGAFGTFEVTERRQRLHQGRGVPARHRDRGAHPVLHASPASAAAPTPGATRAASR